MLANKFIYSYIGDIPHVKKARYLILADAKVATMVSEDEMFEKGMQHGCFVECVISDTRREMNRLALDRIQSLGCRFVAPKEFREIEAQRERERIKEAFAEAERMIKES